MSKKKIAVLFGGQSSEHVVSCVSAANVIDQIDKEKYDLLLVGITEEGHWVKADSVEDIRSGAWRESKVDVVISPDATKKCALITEKRRLMWHSRYSMAFMARTAPFRACSSWQRSRM